MVLLKILWKIFKVLSLIIGVLVILVLILGLFAKKEMQADKEIVINKPKALVYDYIKLLKNQNDYSKWASMDANMKKSFSGTDGTVGFISAWDGNSDVGKGEQEIKKIEGDRIDYELRFEKPFKSTNTAYMSTTALTDSTTKVTWGFAGKMNYPLNAMSLFVDMGKKVGDDFGEGLINLKNILEK